MANNMSISESAVRGIVRTILDGVKDASMQYGYACDAKDEGDTTLARLHLDEATRRLDGIADWYKKAAEMAKLPDGESPAFRAIWDYYKEMYNDTRAKVGEMRV